MINPIVSSLMILISLVTVSFTATAQTQHRAPESLQECIDLGIKNSKALHSVLMDVRYRQASMGESRMRFLPSITAGAAYGRMSIEETGEITLPPPISGTVDLVPTISDSYALNLSFRQPVFTGLYLVGDLERNRSLLKAQLQDYTRGKQELVFEIEKNYWELFKARRMVEVIRENLDQVEAHLKEVKDFFDQGLVTFNEVLKVEMQLANTSLLQIETEAAAQLAQTHLNLQIGLPQKTVLKQKEPLPSRRPLTVELEVLLRDALESRSDIAALKHRVKSGESFVIQSRSGWYPSIYLTGNLSYAQPNPRIFPPREAFETTWEIGIAGTVDIGKWYTAPYQSQKADARLAQAKDALALLEKQVALEVTKGFLALHNTIKAMDVAERYIRQAEENYRIVRETFETGMALNTELLDAELSLLQAKLKLTEASADHVIAWAALNKALSRSGRK